MADANFSFSIPFTCLGISNFAEYVYIYIYIYIYFFFFKQNAVFFLSDLATRASYNMLPERLTYHGLRKQPTFRDAIRLVSRRNDIQATSAETPYCWHVTIKIWVVLMIGWKSLYPIRRTTQLLVVTCHRYEISALFAQKSFRVETSGDVAKCRLFSEAYYLIVTKRKGNFVKFPAQKQFGIRVRVELENCEYLWKFYRYTFCFCYYIEIVTTLKPFFKRNWKQFFSRS